ncbi:hypothetical protein, partial [Klebsiella pneumoniae]|uniref:hypothetical protein n=1 Tax=Klebsiella pneumoniae TaxID=573 RepID=UPI0019553CB6
SKSSIYSTKPCCRLNNFASFGKLARLRYLKDDILNPCDDIHHLRIAYANAREITSTSLVVFNADYFYYL